MNAERILIAAECIGDAKWFIDKASEYAKERVRVRPADRPEPGRAVPDRQAPMPRCAPPRRWSRKGLAEVRGRPALRRGGQHGEDARRRCVLGGRRTACVQTHGGFGFAEEYDVERKFRETRLYQVAPISTNLILSYIAEHVLGMPRCLIMLPLEGLTVIAVEQAVAAPFCSSRLADAGAHVIKIERPEGDFARGYDAAAKGQSSYFVWLNRGKESVSGRPGDQGRPHRSLERLIASADVLVQNLKPGSMDKLGFSRERLRKDYPTLIILHDQQATATSGPYAEPQGLRPL
jgi:hypothetical protein